MKDNELTETNKIKIDKQTVIELFTDLTRQIKIDIENSSGKEKIQNTFRLQSIQNAIKILSRLKDKDITINSIKDLKGIGSGTIATQKIEPSGCEIKDEIKLG